MKNNFLFWRMFRGGDTGDMDIDSDSFIETLARSNYPGPDDDSEIEQPEEPKEVKPHWWEFRYLKGFRFLAIAGVGLMMLTIVITYSIIFVNDVILFENQIHINDQGAFNPHKSMNCEYGLYLFNTADVWANSGIQVSKGDRIKVNVSGGFQSSVENIIRFADDNKELKYRWVYYNNEGGKEVDSADRSALPYCLFRYGGKVDAHNRDYKELPMAFGAAMIGIFPESENLGGNPIIDDKDRAERVWEWTKSCGRKFEKAKYSGTLHFAVNDMYFKNDGEMESFYCNPSNHNFSGNSFTTDEIDSRRNKPDHDYKDNLGQLMVAVEIQRHTPHAFFHPIITYREYEYSVTQAIANHGKGFVSFLLRVWYFLRFSAKILILFALWSIGLVCGIYLLTLLGHLTHTGISGLLSKKKA